MKLDIVVVPDFRHQTDFAAALSEGLAAHGITARVIPEGQEPETELVACWGWRIGEQLHAQGKRVLVAERGYLGDREVWTSLAWDGLNGRGIFGPVGDQKRFDPFRNLLQPWKPAGAYALIIGQVDGDASLGGRDLAPWYCEMARSFAPARFRPHPVSVERGQDYPIDGAPRLDGSLADALARAHVVVTWNSNAGVDAVLAGKPTIAFDCGSMAWPVATHYSSIDTTEPDRERWAASLAWKQWSHDEIRSGFAWDSLRQAIEMRAAA
jgi:hypothetical protein